MSETYREAGVDIDAGQRAIRLMQTAVQSTYNAAVLAGIGAFGGLYDAGALQQMQAPVLVASTDGVGTKTMVAAQLNQWEGIGQDLVNHCVNDILVQGATPLFFLDYVASARLDPPQIAAVVSGMATACRAAGCVLLGGETAEMPGVYQPDTLDVVGTIIGVVEREQIIDGRLIATSDVLLGLPSTGLHTNGYSLARRVLATHDWNARQPPDGTTLGQRLLAVHRSYLTPVQQLLAAGVTIQGLAHITGGGLLDNLPRILPAGTAASIQRGSWPEPPIFGLIQQTGMIDDAEMFRVFNMGVGMVVVVPPADRALALATLPGDLYAIGSITAGTGNVVIQ
ncbi:MAG: phosphoribosylformylglycinamidine cyclo-ligase [Chloroflexaceae bacterium]|nr:phosphoribosylformylglycinamidine cyclo-ligase [Chloroflexaceae bacterium]